MFGFKNNKNISIGGIDVSDLAKQYGTPLIAYDQKHLEQRVDLFLNSFKSDRFNTEILFASKSASIIGLYKVLDQKGLSFDVVSSGEIFIALKAGINSKKIYFHGNNKTRDEIYFAVENNIGTIMVDNFYELKLLSSITKKLNKSIDIIQRVNPYISAGANEKIKTAEDDSKFGISIYNSFDELKEVLDKNNLLNFRGFHSHIGSQILKKTPFFNLVDELKSFTDKMTIKFSFDTLNFGGGFGVKYTDEDFKLKDFLEEYIIKIEKTFYDIKSIKRIMIEPGRSMVAESSVTIYTIGGFKQTSSGKQHLYVDGGMTDNIRPTLYDAHYTYDINNNSNGMKNYIISGKCCESGDTLAKSYSLPKASIGQHLVSYTTGAYTFSMASNYNQIGKPEVILIKDKKVKVIHKRQSFEDLISNM